MDDFDKKYYLGLLKRIGYTVGGALLIAYGVHTYRKYNNKESLEKIVDSSVVDSLNK